MLKRTRRAESAVVLAPPELEMFVLETRNSASPAEMVGPPLSDPVPASYQGFLL
ncbi:hypothetical protein ACLB1M_18100 [Escherichia coli]